MRLVIPAPRPHRRFDVDKDCPGCKVKDALQALLDEGYPEELIIHLTLEVLAEVMEGRGHYLEFSDIEQVGVIH